MGILLLLLFVVVPPGADSVQTWRQTLTTSTDALELQRAVFRLALSRDSTAPQSIRSFLADTARYVEPDIESLPAPQGTAAFYLGQLGDTLAIPVLDLWLQMSGHEKTRIEAAAALVRLGEPTRALHVLEFFALEDSTPPVNRVRSVNAFFLEGNRPWLPDSASRERVTTYMRRLAAQGDPYIRSRALEWLAAVGENPADAYRVAMVVLDSTRNEAARASAFRTLMALGTPEARDRVRMGTYDWQNEIRLMASRFLKEQEPGEPDE